MQSSRLDLKLLKLRRREKLCILHYNGSCVCSLPFANVHGLNVNLFGHPRRFTERHGILALAVVREKGKNRRKMAKKSSEGG